MRRRLCLLLILALSFAPAAQAGAPGMAHGDCDGMQVSEPTPSYAHANHRASDDVDERAAAGDSGLCHCQCGCSGAHSCTASPAALPVRRAGCVAPVHDPLPGDPSWHSASHDRLPPLRPPIALSC